MRHISIGIGTPIAERPSHTTNHPHGSVDQLWHHGVHGPECRRLRTDFNPLGGARLPRDELSRIQARGLKGQIPEQDAWTVRV